MLTEKAEQLNWSSPGFIPDPFREPTALMSMGLFGHWCVAYFKLKGGKLSVYSAVGAFFTTWVQMQEWPCPFIVFVCDFVVPVSVRFCQTFPATVGSLGWAELQSLHPRSSTNRWPNRWSSLISLMTIHIYFMVAGPQTPRANHFSMSALARRRPQTHTSVWKTKQAWKRKQVRKKTLECEKAVKTKIEDNGPSR